MAELIVCGSSALFWSHFETLTFPNTRLCFGRLYAAVADTPLVELSGQSASRPWDVPSPGLYALA